MKKYRIRLIWLLLFSFCFSFPLFAESEPDSYRPISDPFGDPSDFEFAEGEKADKEFFHLGRFLMVGVDLGFNIFTGGLGSSIDPGFYVGGKLLYFFDKQLAFEATGHFSNHKDLVVINGSQSFEFDVSIIPITGGMRFYFDTNKAPRAIALANPYLAGGAGAYMRDRTLVAQTGVNVSGGDTSTTAFGLYAGAGVEFAIYRKTIYLGLDLRYHFVFFDDEDDTIGGTVEEGSRGGDLFTPTLTLTYNF